MKPINRAKMMYVYLAFIFAWYAGAVLAAHFFDLTTLEGVGVGTAGGVLIGAFKDAWQFLWRQSSPQEKAADNVEIEKPK